MNVPAGEVVVCTATALSSMPGHAQVYSLALGRRKSWIVPIQATSGVALLLSANWADARLQVTWDTGSAGFDTQCWLLRVSMVDIQLR